eukprot:TRINITY_DN14885_c0_g1_i1.p1 TRINITY_DN14885_c0_g1~~TRINITY_DN14885_c0_g1_i1.p1  ORF type:complete len:129 (-),score=14.79 TRINITY_DN14885_c0_g1_i1:2-388(-)
MKRLTIRACLLFLVCCGWYITICFTADLLTLSKISPQDPSQYETFGFSFTLSGDERTVFVGAPTSPSNNGSCRGYVGVYTRPTSIAWVQQQRLVSECNDFSEEYYFGYALDVDDKFSSEKKFSSLYTA